MKSYLFNFKSESKAIRTLFIWSLFTGVIYSCFKYSFPSFNWLEDIFKGGFVVTFFGGVYLRMSAAKRERKQVILLRK